MVGAVKLKLNKKILIFFAECVVVLEFHIAYAIIVSDLKDSFWS